MKDIPIESAESCAKTIVKGICEKELYVIEPCWMRVVMWMKMFFSGTLEWILHLKAVKLPAYVNIKKNMSKKK